MKKKGFCFILSTMILLAGFAAGSRAASAGEKITMVVGPYVGYVQIWQMGRYAKKYGIDLDLRKMFTFTQMQQAIELGRAEVGTLGYQNLVLMANAGGSPKAQAVAGVYRRGQDIVFHKDVKISKWKDIEGKTIARVPGSFADFLFRFAARSNGVNMKNVKLRALTPSPTMHLALERRDVDALVVWVPALAFPIANGFGYSAPITINKTSIGNINATLGMATKFIKKGKVAVDLMKAYVESSDYYAKNKAAWMKGAKSLTGMKANVLEVSHNFLIFDTNLYPEKLKILAKNAHALKMVKNDTSATVGRWVNLDVQKKARGM
ncbi:MAG: ABC transporter substrate-binding protein [Nitrospinota bacterium]|nr:ABC transporter substrate-binding protein [Nitrospinota bacterium]